MTDQNINLFISFKDTDLAKVVPNDIIFEIGNKFFGIYKVPRNMNIETLNKIGPYINKLILSGNTKIEELNIKYFYNLTSLNLRYNKNTTDAGIRRTSEGKSSGLRFKDLVNLTSLYLSNNKIITDAGIKDLVNLTSLNLYANKKITDAGIRGTSEGKSSGLRFKHLVNLTFVRS